MMQPTPVAINALHAVVRFSAIQVGAVAASSRASSPTNFASWRAGSTASGPLALPP
jgi:hypothetical protein